MFVKIIGSILHKVISELESSSLFDESIWIISLWSPCSRTSLVKVLSVAHLGKGMTNIIVHNFGKQDRNNLVETHNCSTNFYFNLCSEVSLVGKGSFVPISKCGSAVVTRNFVYEVELRLCLFLIWIVALSAIK
jgi:hypothetical protein